MARKILTPVVIAAFVGGAFAIAGIYIQAEIERSANDTEAFRDAVDQLGKVNQDGTPNIDIRQGGIRGLGLLAHASEDHHWPIMETLTAYIRENTVKNTKETCTKRIRVDIQAALTVIGGRSATHRKKEKDDDRSLNLTNSCLYLADLSDAHLERADLRGAKGRSEKAPRGSMGFLRAMLALLKTKPHGRKRRKGSA